MLKRSHIPIVIAILWLLCISCTSVKQNVSDTDLSIMEERYSSIHEAYLSSEMEQFTLLLRATLRHARRLNPSQCVDYQRRLIETGNRVGFDGLESIWLVYQDCASSGDGEEFEQRRLSNAELLKQGLNFKQNPLPHLPLRVTYWNSLVERGVRGDAARVLLEEFMSTDLSVSQRWSIYDMLEVPAVDDALCSLPLWLNQNGSLAVSELLRQAGCLTGTGPIPGSICEGAFQSNGGDESEQLQANEAIAQQMSSGDVDRLRDFCQGLGRGSGGSSIGMDSLDNFSMDQCIGEGISLVNEAQRVTDLVAECFLSSGNPIAGDGTTGESKDLGSPKFYDKILIYKISPDSYGAAFTTTKGGNPSLIGLAYGSTPSDALRGMLRQWGINTPDGVTVTAQGDGTVLIEHDGTTVQDPDGSGAGYKGKSEVYVGPDGSSQEVFTGENPSSGGGFHSTTTKNPDGSSTSTTMKWDSNGNVTQTKTTTTDKDGNSQTTKTTYEHDDAGNVVNTDKDVSTGSETDGINTHSAACQELMATADAEGSGFSRFWNEVYGRPYYDGPETINPNPNDEATWSDEPFCGAEGLGNNRNASSQCKVPVLCEEGTTLDNSCQCKRGESVDVPMYGCIYVTCPADTIPVPAGAIGCSCQSAEDTDSNLPLPNPLTDSELIDMFTERIWNNSSGEVVITDGMILSLEANHTLEEKDQSPP